MILRIRTNVAWLMRGIAKRLNVRANAIDPIKLRPAPIDNLSAKLNIAQAIARDIIKNAAGR